MRENKIYAFIEYDDKYVQPIILSALHNQIPQGKIELIGSFDEIDDRHGRDSQDHDRESSPCVLQIRAYEAIDFEYALHHSRSSLCNAYIIRKALIRKHYLSHTVHSWKTKHPDSQLGRHFKPAVEFELDYAEFLDDALLEAYELTDSFAVNEGKPAGECEWWILKPSMSDRGQGIRLFRSEQDLRAIFERWDAENPDSEEEADEHEEADDGQSKDSTDYIMTSHLRHFVAQRYINPPLLIPSAPYSNRKFHIRTYCVAAGALKVYVYRHMLALFASQAYQPPWETECDDSSADSVLEKLRNIHLTNTCVQTSTPSSLSFHSAAPPIRTSTAGQGNEQEGGGEKEEEAVQEKDGAVYLLSSLPLSAGTHASITAQINEVTASLFRGAATQPTNFQPLPQAFELFGVDFLVDSAEHVWLLEVNAFPDFAQTGPGGLKELVVGGLFRQVVKKIVGPYFDIDMGCRAEETCREVNAEDELVKVLDMDLGRR